VVQGNLKGCMHIDLGQPNGNASCGSFRVECFGLREPVALHHGRQGVCDFIRQDLRCRYCGTCRELNDEVLFRLVEYHGKEDVRVSDDMHADNCTVRCRQTAIRYHIFLVAKRQLHESRGGGRGGSVGGPQQERSPVVLREAGASETPVTKLELRYQVVPGSWGIVVRSGPKG